MMTPHDRQAQAYRGAGPADRWDGDLSGIGAELHSPLVGLHEITLPDDYEQGRGWDTARWRPKTLLLARAELAHRIADHGAPETIADTAAYDHLTN